jgi:hypothetical protein
MNWRKLLSSSGLMRSGNIISQHLGDPATMKLIDEAFISGAKAGVPGKLDKASKAYSKLIGAGYLPGKAVYGPAELSFTRLGAPIAATTAGVTFGGAGAKPFLHGLNSLYAKLAPEVAAKGVTSVTGKVGLSNLAVLKPGIAASTAAPLAAAKALGALGAKGAVGLIAANPLTAGLAAPMLAIGAAKGTGKLLSRLGRSRRLALLRKGISPKAYKLTPQQLKQYGLT